MVEVTLPDGGYVVTILEAYFDESMGVGIQANPSGGSYKVPIMCVAGYLIEATQAKLLAEEWQSVLDAKGLPYFHMVDCAHGAGVFANLAKSERIAVAARMIGLIKKRTVMGAAIAVNLDHYNFFMPKHGMLGTPYAFCTHSVIGGIGAWRNKAGHNGDVSYFFESGHSNRSEANRIMNRIFSEPKLRERTGYVAHAFMDKEKAQPLQAADLLAWQFYTDIRRQLEGKKQHRKDFASLIEHPHQVTFVVPRMMVDIADAWGYDTKIAEEKLLALGFTPSEGPHA